MRVPRPNALFLILIGIAALAGCDPSEPESPQSEPAERQTPSDVNAPAVDPRLAQATEALWEEGEQWLSQAVTACEQMHRSIDALLETPEAPTLEQAREHWHDCHNAWHRLDPLLSLTDSNPGLFRELARRRLTLHAHPIQPGYLDRVEGYPRSGIVYDISLSLNASSLREQHGLTDAGEVVLGLHSLEFMLWGEKGERPPAELAHQNEPENEQLAGELTEDQLPRNRRRVLLRLVSQLLQDDLAALREDWSDSHSALAAPYHRLPPASRVPLLRDALQELLDDRLPAYLATDEEDTAHTPYAGQSQATVHSALEAVQTMLELDPLNEHLIPLEERDRWQSQWQQLLAQGDDMEPSELSEALRALAERLRPEVGREALPTQTTE